MGIRTSCPARHAGRIQPARLCTQQPAHHSRNLHACSPTGKDGKRIQGGQQRGRPDKNHHQTVQGQRPDYCGDRCRPRLSKVKDYPK